MKTVVTGGSGRLGRSVIAELAASGHDVISIDRVRTAGFAGRQVLDLDLTDADAVRGFLEREAPDAVVHLAAIATPFSAPERVILETNMRLAFTILDAARETGVGRVLVASSPTVIGYGNPTGWAPDYLPLDEAHSRRPWHAYGLAKVSIEEAVAMFARQAPATLFGAFRPCFVIAPEEWHGAPTQQGHTVAERLIDPALAAVALFNYVDARDAAGFVIAWLERATALDNGEVFFVGADDALATEPLTELLPRHVPSTTDAAAILSGTAPAFTSARAADRLGWRPRHSWRTALAPDQLALVTNETTPSPERMTSA